MPAASDVKIKITAQDKTKAAFRSVNKSLDRSKRAASGLVGVLGTLATAFSIGKVINVVTGFEKLNASLVTVTGSAEEANKAMAGIQQFAATVPFSINEVTDSFIKLKAFGLDPSERALTSYANTAAAMGKSLNQVIEAVADAATGEFERLKEFGIKAKTQGDKVIFTFRGIKTEVNKTAKDIEKFITEIGSKDFAGAAALQVDTLGGAFVNLGDQVAIATNELAKSSGFVAWLKETSLAISEIISFTQRVEDPLSAIGAEMGRLSDRQQDLRAQLKVTGDADVWDGLFRQLQDVNAQIDIQKKKFDEAIAAKNKLGTGAVIAPITTPTGDGATSPAATKIVAAAKEATDEWDIAFAKIDAEFAQLDEEWANGFLGLNVAAEQVEVLAESTEEVTNQMSVFADEAARQMQRSFSDFLFDPFKEDGLRGMLDGFVTTLRQMASQAASAKIFESLGGLSGSGNSFISAIGTFFGSASSNATGGPLRAGELSRINEIEPEFFVPRTSGMVIPLSKMPETGGTINVSVTAPPSSSSQSASQFGFEVAQALRLADSRNG